MKESTGTLRLGTDRLDVSLITDNGSEHGSYAEIRDMTEADVLALISELNGLLHDMRNST